MKPAVTVTLFLVFAGACTTLGPMPATTGVSAMPIGRPGVDVQGGGVPGFYASQSAQNDAQGTPIRSLSALVDPDRWLPFRGLIVGGRTFGESGDMPFEPYVGYRRTLVPSVGFGVIGFGSSKRAESNLASYHGVRVGAEAAVNAQVWQPSPWLGVHVQGAASLTRIGASGRYCIDPQGLAKDCDLEMPEMNTFVNAETASVYPAATGTLAVEVGKHDGVFDRVRFALMGTAGRMPLLDNGQETGTGTYFALGVSASIGIGLGSSAGKSD